MGTGTPVIATAIILIIGPVLGITVVALALAKSDYSKWVKWVLPKLTVLACICWASLIILTQIGWQ